MAQYLKQRRRNLAQEYSFVFPTCHRSDFTTWPPLAKIMGLVLGGNMGVVDILRDLVL